MVTIGSRSCRSVRAKVSANAAGGAPKRSMTRKAATEAKRTSVPAEVRTSRRKESGYGLDRGTIGGSRWTSGSARPSTVAYEPGHGVSHFTFLRPADAASWPARTTTTRIAYMPKARTTRAGGSARSILAGAPCPPGPRHVSRGRHTRRRRGERGERGEGGEDVGELGADVVRDGELDEGEAQARGDDGGEHLEHAPEAGEQDDEVRGDDQREEGQLPAHHRREVLRGGRDVAAEDRGEEAAQGGDRDADRAEGDRRGVGDEGEDGGRHRLEAEAGEHRGADRDGGAEAGDALDEGAEAEGHEQRLDAPVLGEAGERAADDVEVAARHGEVVEEDRVQDRPS